jgi:phosphoenolpyruvate synthase/pyruvate phosphate dikinase
MILESVPNVTEKQKKEISELLQKQQDDMKKLREEMSAKIQTIRETNRKSLDNILTEEQRKYIDAKKGNTGTTPAKK